MKPFNLEKAKAGAPLVTRGGCKVKFIGYSEDADPQYRLVVLIEYNRYPSCYQSNGIFGNSSSDQDLFMAPNLVTKYVNLSNSGVYRTYDTEAGAKCAAAEKPRSYLAIAVPVQVDMS